MIPLRIPVEALKTLPRYGWFPSGIEQYHAGEFVCLQDLQNLVIGERAAPADAGIRSAEPVESMPDADIRQLMKFYSAIDLTELARIQARHVERLQSKLPKDNQPAVTFPRG